MAAHHLKRSQGARFGVYAGRVLLQYARCAVALIYLPCKTLGLVKITRWPLHVESWRIWNYQPREFFKLTRLCHFNVSVSRNGFGDTCEELELSSIGEIIGITKAADLVDPDEGKMDISIETRVPPAHTIGKPRKALRIQVFLVIRSSFFARQIPLVFYSALDWEVTNQEKNSRDPPTESQSGKEMKQ